MKNWISCKENLPIEHEAVLALTKDGREIPCVFRMMRDDHGITQLGFDYNRDKYPDVYSFTH